MNIILFNFHSTSQQLGELKCPGQGHTVIAWKKAASNPGGVALILRNFFKKKFNVHLWHIYEEGAKVVIVSLVDI